VSNGEPQLDVERLREALNVDWSPAWHETPTDQPHVFDAHWDKGDLARLIAAEYDRLANSEPHYGPAVPLRSDTLGAVLADVVSWADNYGSTEWASGVKAGLNYAVAQVTAWSRRHP
jgi:hypothetical protein